MTTARLAYQNILNASEDAPIARASLRFPTWERAALSGRLSSTASNSVEDSCEPLMVHKLPRRPHREGGGRCARPPHSHDRCRLDPISTTVRILSSRSASKVVFITSAFWGQSVLAILPRDCLTAKLDTWLLIICFCLSVHSRYVSHYSPRRSESVRSTQMTCAYASVNKSTLHMSHGYWNMIICLALRHWMTHTHTHIHQNIPQTSTIIHQNHQNITNAILSYCHHSTFKAATNHPPPRIARHGTRQIRRPSRRIKAHCAWQQFRFFLRWICREWWHHPHICGTYGHIYCQTVHGGK